MRDAIISTYPDRNFMFVLGLDDAIIGVEDLSMKVVYSESKCLEIFMRRGMTFQEASDNLEFNVKSAYMGEKTPIFVDDTM